MNHAAMTRDEALSQIQRLMQLHGLSVRDISAGVSPSGEKKGGHLQALLAYVGAAFILGGIGTYTDIVWDDLTSLARVALSLGTGIVVYILGLMAIGDLRLARAVTPLVSLGAFLQTGGLFVYLKEYSHGGNEYLGQMLVFGVMAAQLALSFWSRKRTDLGFLAILGFMGFAQAALSYIGIRGEWIAMVLGLSGLSIAWGVDKTECRAMAPFGYLFSSAAIAVASFDILGATYSRQNPGLDILLPLASVGLVAFSIAARSRVVLFVGVAHLLAAMGYYTDHYFKDAVGWPIALIAMGTALVGLSAFAVKLGRGFSYPRR